MEYRSSISGKSLRQAAASRGVPNYLLYQDILQACPLEIRQLRLI